MVKVKFVGCRYEMQKVEFTKLLRYKAYLDLKTAKHFTDEILEGKIITIELPNMEEARQVAEYANSLGVISEIIDN